MSGMFFFETQWTLYMLHCSNYKHKMLQLKNMASLSPENKVQYLVENNENGDNQGNYGKNTQQRGVVLIHEQYI